MKRVYHTDGTPLGFFTAVFQAYKDETAYITSSNSYQTELGEIWLEVENDNELGARVVNGVRKADDRAFKEIDCILRSNDEEKEQIAFEYLRLVMKFGSHAREKLHLPAVRRAIDVSSRIWTEVHRLHGFLRFEECENGVFYAPCSPDNDIIDLLVPHFVARFKNTAFVIHDVTRKLAAIYDGKEWILAPAENALLTPSKREQAVSRLWTEYYHTVAIPMRKNTRQMKNYMPVRYWRFMTEKQGDDI